MDGTLHITTIYGDIPCKDLASCSVLTHTGHYRDIEVQQRDSRVDRWYIIDILGHHTPFICQGHVHILTKTDQGNVACPAKHVTDSMYVAMPRKHVHKQKGCMNGDDAWMCGYFMGDGWNVDSGKRTYFAVNDKMKDVVVQKLSASLLSLRHAGQCVGCSKYYAKDPIWWPKLNSFGKYAHGKSIPHWVFTCSHEVLWEFVHGYMNADGHIRESSGRWQMKTVSERLALGMQRMLGMLGHRFCVSHYHPSSSTVDICGRQVHQRDTYTIHGAIASTSHVDDMYVWYKVKSVSKLVLDVPRSSYDISMSRKVGTRFGDDVYICCNNIAVRV